MSDVKWTLEQQKAISEKGSNILVAAAAGSGKTAVLVERIINKVLKDKIDIDKILVVTFTNAAASEMRGKILMAIYKKLEEEPENENLQRQLNLINKASICTIHAFCLDIIRNNFFELNISANFRVGDSTEIELLKEETIEELFEEKYISNDENFLKLINLYTDYKSDEALKQIILKIYKDIQSNPFPKKWIEEKVEMFNLTNKLKKDFSETIWGEILLNNIKEEIFDGILKLQEEQSKLEKYIELEKYKNIIKDDIELLRDVINKTNNWDDLCQKIDEIKFKTWLTDKKVTNELKDEAKEVRKKVKEKIKYIKENYLIYNSEQANKDIFEMYSVLKMLKDLILEFSEQFSKKKKEKNIIDFNDIEHFALEILIKENSEVAKKYKEKFEEILIDEYQDSNLVQEYILNNISKGNNIFMVGDVKQSIYKFRQARPELFLEKYNTYNLEKKNNKGLKIKLFKNFRSRQNILDFTNTIFQNIMNIDLGEIEYNEEEYLNLGANFTEIEGIKGIRGKTEINLIDLKELPNDIYISEEDDVEEETFENIEDIVLEAKFVANKIKELINNNYMVFDKNEGYRKIKYKDIAVLFRAPQNVVPIFEKEILQLDIPVFSDVSGEFLESVEVQTIISLLKIIDNPMQDIPLLAVMRSSIGNFTDNELIEIRLVDKKECFYKTLQKAAIQLEAKLKNKINDFVQKLENWQNEKEYKALDEFIWDLYIQTNYYNYVALLPNGIFRQANLKLLFEKAKQYESGSFKELFNFINFIDKLKIKGDISSAKLIGENENVVRLMSIHKSKGLEFPVIILSNTGKRFNTQDTKEKILLHQELGFGPKYINENMPIECTTLAKEALKIKLKLELISEEMRILYVALTRAKEKLIITGNLKDFEKSKKEKTQLLEIYKNINKNNKISPLIIKKYISYLDWILLVYLNNVLIEELVELNIYKKEELLKKFNNIDVSENDLEEILQRQLNNISDKEVLKIASQIEWEYNFLDLIKSPTKTSVTKLKQKTVNVNSIEELVNKNLEVEEPKFLKGENISAAQKGTLMHMCFQKLDEKKDYSNHTLRQFVDKLVKDEIITEKEAKVINIDELYKYINSQLWNKLKNAKKVFKEVPFYLNGISNKLEGFFEEKDNKNILIQGVIDLYFIDENEKINLVDYKTDYIETEQQLIDKYKIQLNFYKEALEKGINKKVDNVYLYSVKLQKLIKVE